MTTYWHAMPGGQCSIVYMCILLRYVVCTSGVDQTLSHALGWSRTEFEYTHCLNTPPSNSLYAVTLTGRVGSMTLSTEVGAECLGYK